VDTLQNDGRDTVLSFVFLISKPFSTNTESRTAARCEPVQGFCLSQEQCQVWVTREYERCDTSFISCILVILKCDYEILFVTHEFKGFIYF